MHLSMDVWNAASEQLKAKLEELKIVRLDGGAKETEPKLQIRLGMRSVKAGSLMRVVGLDNEVPVWQHS